MCICSIIAVKINIFSRDINKLTNIDILITYAFIISSFTIILLYSIKYHELVYQDINICKKTYNINKCSKTEFFDLIIPYIGIMGGVIITLYNTSNFFAIIINYILNYYYCLNSNMISHSISHTDSIPDSIPDSITHPIELNLSDSISIPIPIKNYIHEYNTEFNHEFVFDPNLNLDCNNIVITL